MQTTDSYSPNRFEDLLTRLPLAWISIGFLGGIWFADQVTLPWLIWLIAAGVMLIAALLVRLLLPRLSINLPVQIFLIILTLLGVCLGAFRYQSSAPQVDAATIANYNDLQYDLLITGVIDAPPDVRDTYTNLRLRVNAVDAGKGDLPIGGLVLAGVDNDDSWHYGDVVRLRGRLITPPEYPDFSYRDYLARQGIHSYLPYATVTHLPYPPEGNPILRLVYAFKEFSLGHIYQIFPDPEASLMAGILLGNDNGLSFQLQQAFRNTGTAHIIAISGFNITIIAGLFIFVFGRLFGRRRGNLTAAIGIVMYTILVGASPSVMRAAFMGILGILARQVGRRQSGLNGLSLTAAFLAVLDQNVIWDVGFQLSFFATLGIILYAQPLQEWAVRLISRFTLPETAGKVARFISDYVLITLAAQLTVLPIMAWHFQRIPLVSLIANPFILPVQPLVMILGGVALVFSLIYLPLGQILAWLAWPFPAYTIRAVELFDRLPHTTIILRDFSILFVLAFYAILFAYTFSRGRLQQTLRAASTPVTILVVLSTLTFLSWKTAFTIPDGNLRVIFLDADSADAILIQTPAGRNILVNGGSSPSALSEALGRFTSPFDRRLDWLIVASTVEDQLSALPSTLDRIPPENVLWSGNIEASYASADLDRWLADHSIPVLYAVPGMSLDLGSGARLNAQYITSRGAILLVEWNGFRLLLPIGQNFDSLEATGYGASLGPVTVLLLSDAGLAQTNPPEWISNLHAQLVILSVEAGDDSGLPDASVLESIRGTTLLRTDRNGWIEISTDGERMSVNVQKK